MTTKTTYSLMYYNGETERLEDWDFGLQHDTVGEALARAAESFFEQDPDDDLIIRRHIEEIDDD